MDVNDKVEILGVHINRGSMVETVEICEEFLNNDGFKMVFTPNAEIVMKANEETELKSILNSADLLIPDGIGVVLASKILSRPVKEKVAGFDLMNNLLKKADEKGYKIYMLGGKPGIVEKAIVKLQNQYKNINFVGYRDGYFKGEDEKLIIDKINSAAPDVLFVALGAPKQEYWINSVKDKLIVKLAIGVGGSFDILAGEAKRAPKIFIKLGLEWFYRLLKEPWRFKRMLALPKFAMKVLKYKILHK